jgi:hypothetical protein
MTSGTSGRSWRAPFAFYDPDMSCLRTSQAMFLSDLTPSSLILPRWGMWAGGEFYELPMPALPTDGPACSSLLKTPTAQLAVNGGSQHPDKRKAGGHGPTLADEVEHLLPTPRATDGTKGGPNQRGSSGDLMLPSAVMLLPTPRATRGGSATETVYLLPTPTAQDAAGSRNSTVPRQEGSTAHPGDTLTDAMTVLTGARTRARSNGGSESSDGRLLGQLSLDEAESG